ncbi:MAG: hypothetical protein KAI66_08935 [Lentisphaeria bacterium]|nr:hypothetical protein [Lentisphaeria bacterium]
MKRVKLLAVVVVFGLSWGALAQRPALAPFRYHEGFETGALTFERWASNGEAEVVFNGPVEEEAAEGKRSHKFEIVLKGGSYHYYGVRVPVACEGELVLRARILVGEGTTASVGFGTNVLYPPTRHSGCSSFARFKKATDGWQNVECDLVERGRSGCDSVLKRHTTNLTGENGGAVLEYWSLFITGKAGDRAVVYVDEVEIEGRVPDQDAYREWVDTRLVAAKAAFLVRVQGWEKDLDALAGQLPPVAADSAVAPMHAYLQGQIAECRTLLETLRKQGYARQDKVESVLGMLGRLRAAPANLRAISAALAENRPFSLLAQNRPIVDSRVDPALPPFGGSLNGALKMTACRGEFESVTATVFAHKNLTDLRVTVTDLEGIAGKVPADRVDIRMVKWWYQGAGGIGYSPKRVLKAELLVKDPELVRVDTTKKENSLRHTATDGTVSYRLCSGDTSENLAGVRPVDAQVLQPVDVPVGSGREFWINVHVPETTTAGVYKGRILFETGKARASMTLQVTVPTFDLEKSPLVYSIYYRAKLSADGQPTITSELRSEQQYRAEIADMRDHGVLYPTNYQSDKNLSHIRRVLEMRREAGMPTDAFYSLGRNTGSTTDPGELEKLRTDVRRWKELCGEFGYREVYFYGIDEARGDRLKGQRATWGAVQEAGGKTFVACYTKTFEAMGALLNCAVLARAPNLDEAKKWHGVGSTIFCYANPQVGPETPAVFRRNFGLVLWKSGYDGAMDYAYQHGFGHVWNDFDSRKYRDHNFTYPTMDGVVGTVQWEGFREGVDDVRYVATLEKAITRAGSTALSRQARAWLDALNPAQADLDDTRATMILWIEKLAVK